MTAINSLFDKMQQFVTHENVVFMLDPKHYEAVEGEGGGGGSGKACQFGMIGSMFEGGDYVPPPTYPNWTAGQIGWNAEGTVLKVSVWGTAAHFGQSPKIRIYAKGLNADVLDAPNGGWIYVPDDLIPESVVVNSNGTAVTGGAYSEGYSCNEFIHTKEPTYPPTQSSTWLQDGNNSWHGVAEIPAEKLIPHPINSPTNTRIEIHAAVIFEDRVPAFPGATNSFTHGASMCNVLIFDIPDKETLYPEPIPISCEGATPSITILNQIFGYNVERFYNSDIEVFVNGVSRGIWPCSENSYQTIRESVNLPELTITEAIRWEGLLTTITNTSNEPVRLEFRTINAPIHSGGQVIADPNTGLYNPSMVIEFPKGKVAASIDPDGNNPWDILKVCLAPSTNVACEPTSFVYNGFARLVTIPTDPNPVLYYKVQVQIDNDPPTEHILVNSLLHDSCGVLFVQLLLAILNNTPVSVVGDITAYDADGNPYNYDVDYGEFGCNTNYDYRAIIHGYLVFDVPGNKSTTLTFLIPSQAELDAFSAANGVTAVDGANLLFAEYPTWHSCGYIPGGL